MENVIENLSVESIQPHHGIDNFGCYYRLSGSDEWLTYDELMIRRDAISFVGSILNDCLYGSSDALVEPMDDPPTRLVEHSDDLEEILDSFCF